jgi:SAM-dependent methyltransferase
MFCSDSQPAARPVSGETQRPEAGGGGSAAQGLLDAQRTRWATMLGERAEMFGSAASVAAQAAAGLFARRGVRRVVEFGGGQGRDALLFAARGLEVTVLDYAPSGVEAIARTAVAAGLTDRIRAVEHDVRRPLPLAAASVDACYSHMLLCMALTRAQQHALCAEAWRILRPGGVHVFTVRNSRDAHHGRGRHHGEGLYETDGVIVHFLTAAALDELTAGWLRIAQWEFAEGPLPRQLSYVALQRPLDEGGGRPRPVRGDRMQATTGAAPTGSGERR